MRDGDYVTNFCLGHYNKSNIDKFVKLFENGEEDEIFYWDLLKQLLEEPIPSNLDIQNSRDKKINQFDNVNINDMLLNSSNLVQDTTTMRFDFNNMTPHSLIKYCKEHFVEELQSLDKKWKEFKRESDDYEFDFENLLTENFGASTWVPSKMKLNDEYFRFRFNNDFRFYFPCVIATNFNEIDFYRRILGLDFALYNPNLPCFDLKYLQRQWVNVPNSRYLDFKFNNVIACNGGLFVIEEDEQLVKQSTDQSIIVTNPLTNNFKLMPPISSKVLHQKVAQLIFYDQSRLNYRLIVIGLCHHIVKRKELALVVYCSKKHSWLHFELILNAAPPPKKLGYPSIVVHGYSIYYGGVQLHSQSGEKIISNPVIFYFNIKNSQRQKLIIDFIKAGIQHCVKLVEPPKLVQLGNEKVYAVTREQQFGKEPNTLFITEVIIDNNGIPTGSYKVLSRGIMPKNIYNLLFKKNNIENNNKTIIPWEVIGAHQYIAIKAVGYDSIIAFYSVIYANWNLHIFPQSRKTKRWSWRLIQGVYKPNWLAKP